MLKVSQLAGFGVRQGASVAVPASFVFNGVDEDLRLTLSSNGSTTATTISFWLKCAEADVNNARIISSYDDGSNFVMLYIDTSDDSINVSGVVSGGSAYAEFAPGSVSYAAWHHIVVRIDTSEGTADNRIRIYEDGVLISDTNTGGGAPSLNENIVFWVSGNIINIASIGGGLGGFYEGKLAFIDVLEGVSAAPTAFAFDDGGTWTRMPYAGSYGSDGFSLDGSDGFNDVSGNGQNFTGVNMDASNLDLADLPPWT